MAFARPWRSVGIESSSILRNRLHRRRRFSHHRVRLGLAARPHHQQATGPKNFSQAHDPEARQFASRTSVTSAPSSQSAPSRQGTSLVCRVCIEIHARHVFRQLVKVGAVLGLRSLVTATKRVSVREGDFVNGFEGGELEPAVREPLASTGPAHREDLPALTHADADLVLVCGPITVGVTADDDVAERLQGYRSESSSNSVSSSSRAGSATMGSCFGAIVRRPLRLSV